MTKRGDVRRSLERRFTPYRQPSPLGEGAPQGRIGHRRYERQIRKAEKCAAHVGERESLIAMEKISRFARNDNERELPVTSQPSLVPRSGQAHKRPVGAFPFLGRCSDGPFMAHSQRLSEGRNEAVAEVVIDVFLDILRLEDLDEFLVGRVLFILLAGCDDIDIR